MRIYIIHSCFIYDHFATAAIIVIVTKSVVFAPAIKKQK